MALAHVHQVIDEAWDRLVHALIPHGLIGQQGEHVQGLTNA